MAEKVEFYRETEFKDTEIGRIPKEWEVVKLGEVCTKIKAGGTPLTSKKEYYNGNIPFVKIEDMTSSYKYIKSTLTSITEAGLKNSSAWLVPVKSLLVAMYGSIGAIAINEIEVATNQAILAILPNNEKTNVEFLFYLLTHLKPLLKKHAKQTTQANLTAEIIKNFKIALPNYFEQQKIAEILSTVDEAIQKTDDIIAKTERLKEGLMQELLTKGIGHKEFKDTEIGKIPKEWEVVKLSDIAEDIYYGITAKAVENKTGLKMLRTTDIKDYTVDWGSLPFCEVTEKRGDIQRFLLKEGDLIIARAGSTGVSVLVETDFDDVIFGSYLIKIRLTKKVHPKFMRYFCQSRLYWDHITSSQAGSTLKNISLPVLKSLNIPLPSSIEEQQKIAKILSTVDKKLEILKQEKVKLERIKQWFMEELLTGRIRVRVA